MCLMPYVNNKGEDQPAHPRSRAATIHSPHDTIRITIFASRYDTHRDTLFRLEIISNCMRIILWCSTMVFTILRSLFEMVHIFNIFVKVS